jgi:ubiquinone/menaquinone biosynthesis C-methylase UbiE
MDHFHGHAAEEDPRQAWNSPEATLKSIGLKPGMVFADVGCGSGFFTIPAAQLVGSKGLVYAVDANPAAIEALMAKAYEKGLKNIRATVALAEDTVFCIRCVDVVFYSTVLHDFHDPIRVLLNAKKMLLPNGKLVDIDWKKKDMLFGPPKHVRFSEEQSITLIKEAGFTVESLTQLNDYQYMIIAKPASA